MSNATLRPEVPRGAYAEREHPRWGRLDRTAEQATSWFAKSLQRHRHRWSAFVAAVDAEGHHLSSRGQAALRAMAEELRPRLRREGFSRPLVARTFALVRETATRELGQRHFDVQVMGGLVLLDGMIAEMDAGEGKTITATLPACTAALAGVPVHIVTVNDYLAARDAEQMGPVYRALGLSVGVIVHDLDADARRAAYGCDVTYCTNKEVAFDYLRDRIALGRRAARLRLQVDRLASRDIRQHRLLLRGLHYAIVDEADSVLIDEARTPLIIAGRTNHAPAQEMYETALTLARALEPGRDFTLEPRERRVRLTAAGEHRLAELAESLPALWGARQRRESLVSQARAALDLYVRDRHYLLKTGKVQIVDEYTGRIMGDRHWEQGLHQLIELKEGCALTEQQDPLARISYQRFFRRYLRLAGMTGTAREVAGELWSVYRLAVVRLPPNRSLHRKNLGERVYRRAAQKWAAVVDRVARLHRAGRPVLVGTRSVADSEDLSRRLAAAGLSHVVLNARQDAGEAAIVAGAGERGRITVATNMAGRGTDIQLGPGVVELGGLHVIATERHDARRIDRQLFGRCGRQGDPGTYEMFASLEDELVMLSQGPLRWLAGIAAARGRPAPRWLAHWIVRAAQRAAERRHSRMRRELLRTDEAMDTALAFSGRGE